MNREMEEDYIKKYNEFWKDIVENEDGTLKKDQVMRELSDYSMIIDNCTLAYSEMSAGNISKPNTKFFEVKALFDENFWNKGYVQDDIKDMLNQCEELNELKIALRDYFEIEIYEEEQANGYR